MYDYSNYTDGDYFKIKKNSKFRALNVHISAILLRSDRLNIILEDQKQEHSCQKVLR